MKNPYKRIRQFVSSLGLVEQSQVVASTAVIVSMVTIVSIFIFSGQELRWLDFLTLVTVGVFGFLITYFISKYGLQINEQYRQLSALNAISQAVTHSVELETVFHNSLEKVCELLNANCGWIYLVKDAKLYLNHAYKTDLKFFPDGIDISSRLIESFKQPPESGELILRDDKQFNRELEHTGIQSWASIPLEMKNEFGGILIIASRKTDAFNIKDLELLQAFGNQISLALNNAYLFEQIKQSEQLYADLYENLPDMYHSINREGTIVSCNNTESEFLGYSKNEIIGQNILKLYPENQHLIITKRLKNIFDNGKEIKDIDEVMQKKDGMLIDVSVNSSLVYGVDNKPVLVRVVARDITNQKKLEQKIIQAQKIDSIGNLAGGVAHDFNNILNSILGPASMMKRKLKPEDSFYKYVNLIEDSARRGASVTRQLLAFSRKSNIYFTHVDMNKIIEETVRLFERSVPKSTQIRWEISEDSIMVNADEGQIEQAILNLFINAQDAMPQGGVVTISCKPVVIKEPIPAPFNDVQPGSYAAIKVLDTGTGIPSEILYKIFEPFFTTKDQSKGTGLGLSVVFGMVKSHQGYINVESEIGVGTVFTIYLPLVEKYKFTEPELRSENIAGGIENIMLVDDDAGANIVGGDILLELGYKVDIVRDGYQALEKIENKKFYDLVILDLNMPGISGKEVFYKIRKLNPNIKILICSGYSDSILNDDAFINEIDGYLHKPYLYEDLARSVRNVMDNKI